MARKEPISVVLEKAAQIKNTQEKTQFLRQNDNSAVRQVLRYALDPTIKWLLPSGPAPYKPCPYMDQDGQLYSEARTLYLFVEGDDKQNPNLSSLRRESLFIQLLEAVHPKDAELLISIKDKKLPFKGLNKNIVNLAFPGLIKDVKVA